MIALLGGSSQVAIEVAMYLKRQGIPCVSIVRSQYSAIIHRLMDLKCVVCSSGDEEFKQTISSAEVVADFTFPSGLTALVIPISKSQIENTISQMKSGARYVYMSSIWAHGMGPGETTVKNYLFPRGQYSYIKRQVEAFVRSTAQKQNVLPFNLRLGQVHGFLQSVKCDYVVQGAAGKVLLPFSEQAKANIVFTYNVAETLEKINNNEINQGTYTLILSPQWEVKQLYGFYESVLNTRFFLNFKEVAQPKGLKGKVNDLIVRFRPFLETYILMKFPKLALKVKSQFRLQKVAGAFTKNELQNLYQSPDHLTGELNKANFLPLTTNSYDLKQIWLSLENEYKELITRVAQ